MGLNLAAFLSGVNRAVRSFSAGDELTPEEVDRLRAFERLAKSADGRVLMDWLLSLHGEDFMTLRVAKGDQLIHVQGQVARTEEVLRELTGASARLATPRRSRWARSR